MSGNPCENDRSERGEEETGQEPKEPSQSDSVTEDKDKGQEEIGNNEGIKEENKNKQQIQEKEVKKYGYAVYVKRW